MQKTSIPKLPAGVKLSDVFHLAADKYLVSTDIDYGKDKHKYSCIAIEEALNKIFDDSGMVDVFQSNVIEPGLEALGLDCESMKVYRDLGCAFGEVSPKAQAARYSWLKFCAMLAEEQEAAGASWN